MRRAPLLPLALACALALGCASPATTGVGAADISLPGAQDTDAAADTDTHAAADTDAEADAATDADTDAATDADAEAEPDADTDAAADNDTDGDAPDAEPDAIADTATEPDTADTTPEPDAAPPACSTANPCAFPEVCTAGACVLPPPLPYPTRTAWDGKAIQPDFWANKDEIAGNGAGGVAMNLVWAQWQPSDKAPPCKAKEITWQGGCYVVPSNLDQHIAEWTAKGLRVTAVVYGPPAWARVPSPPCSPASAGFEWFCAPKDHAAFGRFAGLLARRYDGQHGVGRIVDFVIHNEVNHNVWFDIGCGNGVACDSKAWLDSYAADFSAAYDAIVAAQPDARVLVSLDHHFGTQWDKPADKPHPVLSGASVLLGVDARVGDRKWRVAMHPYPPNLLAPGFSELDHAAEGKITYGSLGVLAGWLRKSFPNKPWTHEIHLTESGVNSVGPQSSEAAQDKGVCDALRAVLGTPGVVNHVYHRMVDHPDEVAQGLGVGLRRPDKSAKPAWARWALANRKDLVPPKLDCGYEELPYVRLRRGYKAGAGHWATTRLLPPGYKAETDSWRLLREAEAGTVLLYACKVGNHSLVTTDVGCEGQALLGPLGWAWKSAPAKGKPIYRCRVGAGQDHFVSSSASCEGQVVEQLLGYGLP